MTTVKWKNQKRTDVLYFEDLKTNDAFKIDSYQARGAVYLKVEANYDIRIKGALYEDYDYLMMEVQTGLLFKPTKSPVKLVEVEISVLENKPDIY